MWHERCSPFEWMKRGKCRSLAQFPTRTRPRTSTASSRCRLVVLRRAGGCLGVSRRHDQLLFRCPSVHKGRRRWRHGHATGHGADGIWRSYTGKGHTRDTAGGFFVEIVIDRMQTDPHLRWLETSAEGWFRVIATATAVVLVVVHQVVVVVVDFVAVAHDC